MAHKTLVSGTSYDITGGKTLVNGTAYSIKGGKTLVGGTSYDISFAQGVYLVYNGDAVEIPVSDYIGETWEAAYSGPDIILDVGNTNFQLGIEIGYHQYLVLYNMDVYDYFGYVCDENNIVVEGRQYILTTSYYLYNAAIEFILDGIPTKLGINIPGYYKGITWYDAIANSLCRFGNDNGGYFYLDVDEGGAVVIYQEGPNTPTGYCLTYSGNVVTINDAIQNDDFYNFIAQA